MAGEPLSMHFSREAFLAISHADTLAQKLASRMEQRLCAAPERGVEKSALIDELIAPGHPLRQFDTNGGEGYQGSTWSDNWGADAARGDLMFQTVNQLRLSPEEVADRTSLEVVVTFRHQRLDSAQVQS